MMDPFSSDPLEPRWADYLAEANRFAKAHGAKFSLTQVIIPS